MRLGLMLTLAALSLSTASMAQHKNTSPKQTRDIPREEGRDDILLVDTGDKEVNAAIANVQKTLPDFLSALTDPKAYNLTFKFPLGGTEHIWVTQVRRDGDHLTGVLDNVPYQKQWKKGDKVRVPLKQVSDYFFCDAKGDPHGHFTTTVFFDREEGKGFTARMLPRLCDDVLEANQNV